MTNEDYVRRQLNKAENKLDYCKSMWEVTDEDIGEIVEESEDVKESEVKGLLKFDRKLRMAEVIIDSQFCIEQSAKAIIKLMDKRIPQTHGISLASDTVSGVINELPEDYERKEDIKRVIFLTKVWEPFYEAAKYGYPEINASSYSFLDPDDAERALSHAEFSLNTAQNLSEYLSEADDGE